MKLKRFFVIMFITINLIVPNIYALDDGYVDDYYDPVPTDDYDIHNDVKLEGGGTYKPIEKLAFWITIGALATISVILIRKKIKRKDSIDEE